MTITIAEDCASINIVSPNFAEDNQSATLTVTLNCTTTYDDIDITDSSDDYNLDPEALDIDELTLADGIYTLTLVTVDAEGNSTTEQKCVFVNCSTTCDMVDTALDLSTEENMIKAISFHALTLAADCVDCSCTNLCTLYSTVTDETCVTNDSPCGCS